MSTPIAGSVERHGDTATLTFERLIAHDPARIWEALTDSEELGQWYMAKATIAPLKGGPIDMVSGPAHFHWTGKVLTWEPFDTLEYEMNADPHEHLPGGERSVIRYDLTPRDGGTLLRLTHSRLSAATASGFAPGTHALLDRLEALLDETALPSWMGRYDEVKHLYPDWRSL